MSLFVITFNVKDIMNAKNKCQFRWTDAMHTSLLDSLLAYKTKFNGIYFDCDRASQYKAVRVASAKVFVDESPESFGPEKVEELDFNKDTTEEIKKELVKKTKGEYLPHSVWAKTSPRKNKRHTSGNMERQP